MENFLDQGAGNPEDLSAIRNFLKFGRTSTQEPQEEEESRTSYAAVKDRTYREHFDALQNMHSELQRHVNNYRAAIDSGSKAMKERWGSSADLIDNVLDNAYVHLGHALKAHLDKKYTRGYSDLSHYNPVNKRAYEVAAKVAVKTPGEFVSADQKHAGEPSGPTTAFDHMKLAAAALGQVANHLEDYNAAAKVQKVTKFTNNTETYRGTGTYGRMANAYADNYGAKLSRDPEFAENYEGPRPAREVTEPGGPTSEGYSNLQERVRTGDYMLKKFTATQQAEHERRMATDSDYAQKFNDDQAARADARTHLMFQASKYVRGTLITDEVARAEQESEDRYNKRKNTWEERTAREAKANEEWNDPENVKQREQNNAFAGQIQSHIDTLQAHHAALRSLAESVPHGKGVDTPDYTSTEPRMERVTEEIPVPDQVKADNPWAAAAYKTTVVQHPAGITKPIVTRDRPLNKHLNAAARSAEKLNAQLSGNRVSAAVALHAHELAGHLTAAAQHIMESGLGEDLTKLPVNRGALSHLVDVIKGQSTNSANSLDIMMHGADEDGNPKKYPGVSNIPAPSMRQQLGEIGDYYGREAAWARRTPEETAKRYRQLVLEAGRDSAPAPRGVDFSYVPRVGPTERQPAEIGPEPTREETRVEPKLEQFEVGRGNQPFDPRGVLPTGGTLVVNSATGEKTVRPRSTKSDVEKAMQKRFAANRIAMRNLAMPVWEKNNPAPQKPELTGDKDEDEKRLAEYNAPLPAKVTTERGFETGESIRARKEHAEKFRYTNINAHNHVKDMFERIGDHQGYLEDNNVDIMIPHGEEYLNRPMTLEEALPNSPAGRTARMNAAFRGE
jgi:hypothetical protein